MNLPTGAMGGMYLKGRGERVWPSPDIDSRSEIDLDSRPEWECCEAEALDRMVRSLQEIRRIVNTTLVNRILEGEQND